MNFTPQEQFQGFLATQKIFAENDFFDYPLYSAFCSVPANNLPRVTSPTASVLGKRMEHYLACYISHFTSEIILVQNQQIIDKKQTLGELDFLLKDTASGGITHVELVFKFYLFDPDTGDHELDHLIGPNKRDTLNSKLHRLQKRQFPLLFHPATRELIGRLDLDVNEIKQKLCFKATVFLPKDFKKEFLKVINPETIAGFWIRASEFTYEAYGENAFFTPEKKFWPVLPELNKSWHSFDEIKDQIQTLLRNQFSPLLWMKTPQGLYERFFIVWW